MDAGLQQHDERGLVRAVELARRGPLADPNPRVGAVVTDTAGSVVGEGWHEGAGTAHAEVAALRAAGDRAVGGTAYVSLEPCAHHGRTAPCVDALLDAGVRRVVYAAADPGETAGGGGARLARAGVAVTGPVAGTGSEALNRHWSHAVRYGRPFVTLKLASTLDGRVAAADGTSRWITGPAARADVHRRRAEAGAVLVGTGTVLADDPSLTVRDDADRPVGAQPLRVVMGERDVPATARVRGDDRLWQARTRSVDEVLQGLQEREVRHVWLEGGPTVATAFLRGGRVDEVLVYVAPTLLGDGPTLVSSLGVPTLSAAHHLELLDVERLDQDVRLRLRPRPVEGVH